MYEYTVKKKEEREMSFFSKLFKGAATVGATIFGVKVAEKYKENNPDGVQDVNGDGVVDYKDKLEEVKKAAGEVVEDAKAYAKEKKPEVEAKVGEIKEKGKEAVDKVVEKGKEAVNEVKESI